MTRRMKFVGVSLLMVLLQILVFVSARSDDDDDGEKITMERCKNTNDAPKKQPLTFCDDYRSYTCCTSRDTDRILVHHVEMQRQSVSATCASLFGRFECSKCDARNLGGSNRSYGGGSGIIIIIIARMTIDLKSVPRTRNSCIERAKRNISWKAQLVGALAQEGGRPG